MLSTYEVILNSFVVLLFPLAVHSLITRTPRPEKMPLGRLYRADPNLPLVSDLFLLSLCFSCMGRLGLHFGLIEPSLKDYVLWVTGVPFVALLVIFLGLLISAGLKLRRASKTGT